MKAGFGFRGLGFRVWGFRVQDIASECRALARKFRVQG